MYADDLVLYKVINGGTAFLGLLQDLAKIVQWASLDQMRLNTSKYKARYVPLTQA